MTKTPEDLQAGAEIEVTPEMIECGFDILLNYGLTEQVEDAVLDVYREMASHDPARVGSCS